MSEYLKSDRIYSVDKPDTEEGGCTCFDLGNK
ncbi:MAG: hypothetical protein BWX71_01307 [Deltaproteobacteria bacterium ADurb.Bin072]|nr:MAG: hypothetical protein BWX71_01307 [Deltaproteobacteria bacterium ADurb.Bin072]